MRSESFTLVGHRGAMAHAPENSIASFRLAEEMGVDEIELDVRLTADGVAIVLHDATLDRTAADDSGRGLGPVAELSFDQIKDIELDSGRGVLTFDEALDNTTVTLQVEMKAIEVVPELGRIVAARPEDAQRIQFTSFCRGSARSCRGSTVHPARIDRVGVSKRRRSPGWYRIRSCGHRFRRVLLRLGRPDGRPGPRPP